MQIIKRSLLFVSCMLMTTSMAPFSLVLDPSQNNRAIGAEYEKQVSLLYAESIHEYLHTSGSTMVIEITRAAGEMLEELDAAIFSNTLHPDLHISLQCVASEKPILHIYYLQRNKHEKNQEHTNKIELIPASHSYLYRYDVSKKYAHLLYEHLSKTCQNSFYIHTPIGCPCKPLFGITSPAIVIEIGLPPESYFLSSELIADALRTLPLQSRQSL